MVWAKTTAWWDVKQLSFGIWCTLRFDSNIGFIQCSKLLPVRLPEADNFGGGPGTFFKIFFNFMFMIWDSRQEDWQLFWLSFEHWFIMMHEINEVHRAPFTNIKFQSLTDKFPSNLSILPDLFGMFVNIHDSFAHAAHLKCICTERR